MGDSDVGAAPRPPTGTVTFLFTDIVGSTELAQKYPDALPALLARHHAILRQAIESHRGYVFQIVGDSFASAFHTAPDALAAALTAQRALHAEPWGTAPVQVRMGVHTGVAQVAAVADVSGGYTGYSSLARTQRITSAANGGQILLSNASAELVRGDLPPQVSLRDMGEHRLRGLLNPERLWQAVAPDLPQVFGRLQTLDTIPNNLPAALNPLVGRERELREIKGRLAQTHLLTLFGPGGAGKTRLALRAAADLLEPFEDRVYFVDLAPIREPESVLAAIARTIGLRQKSDRPLPDELVAELRTRKTLLILDNFEQVAGAAPVIAQLLQDCPELKLLVTSREALHVRGEQVFPIPPLGLPSGDIKGLSMEQLAPFEAVQLFIERARAVKPEFDLTPENAQAVAEICMRLDGLPLAIELATARLNVLSPQDVLDRLGSRLKLLRGGARDLPARQQTLRATIDWSYEKLTPGEQRLFELLSIFSGATFGAVEDVASRTERFDEIELDILDGLGSLVDKSLIRKASPDGAETRLLMLETIKEYATTRLEEDPAFSATARRSHATYFAELTRRLWDQMSGEGREAALAQLMADLENIKTAWRYWVRERNLEELRKLTDSLWLLYDARGWYHATVELTRDLLQVLSSTASSPERAREEILLQTSLARALLAIKGYTPEVELAYTRALELCEREGEIPQLFPVLRGLSSYYQAGADFEKAVRMGERILSLAEHLDDADMRVEARLVIGSNLGSLDQLGPGLDHLEKGIAAYDSHRPRSRRLGLGANPGVVCLMASALFLWMAGFPNRARERAQDGIALARMLDHPYSLSYALFHAGLLHFWLYEPEIAKANAQALLDVADEHGFQVWSAVGACLNGVALAATGSPEEGLPLIHRGVQAYQGLVSPPVFFPLLLLLEANARGLANRPAEGLELLNQAIEIASPHYGKSFRAEFYRLKGDLLLAMSKANSAEAQFWYQQALNMAREVTAPMLELRAALRLSAAWREQGKAEEAHKCLSEAYAKLTEGFETADLKEARALLQYLALPETRRIHSDNQTSN